MKKLRRALADPLVDQALTVRDPRGDLWRSHWVKPPPCEPGRSIDLHDWTPRQSLIWRSVGSRSQPSGLQNATPAHFIKRVGERLESPHFLLSKNCFARSLPYAIMWQMKLGLRSSFEE